MFVSFRLFPGVPRLLPTGYLLLLSLAASGCGGASQEKPQEKAPPSQAAANGGTKTAPEPPAEPATKPAVAEQKEPAAPEGANSAAARPAGPFVEMTDRVKFAKPAEPWPDGKYLTPEITPGGILVFDYDGDGHLDLYQVCHSAPASPPQSFKLPAPNRLFRNLGNLTFEEVPDAAGLGDTGYGHGGAVGDYDNDGDLDVFVTNYGPSKLYRNEGGRFSEVTAAAGITVDSWSSASSFFDYNRDGHLDLVVVNFATFDVGRRCQSSLDERDADYCGPHTFPGLGDQLFKNNGDGTFTEVSQEAGLSAPARGWGVVCLDVNGDGWDDLLVANDEEPNQLFINQKDGTFKDEAIFYGVAVNSAGRSQANMGIALGDMDHDGRFDFLITHVASETNVLYASGESSGGEVSYADQSTASGMAAVDLPYTGWGCGFFDYDHDGDLDMAIANGRVAKAQVLPEAKLSNYWNRYAEPNLFFRHASGGKYENMSHTCGDFCKHAEVTRGLAFADLDNDGDLDLVTTTVGNTLRLYRNDGPAPGTHWLMVRALSGKRDAYGAMVRAVSGGKKRVALVQPSYSYLASNDPRVHFGLGTAGQVDHLEVSWPDGSHEKFAVPGVDRVLTVTQGTGEKLP